MRMKLDNFYWSAVIGTWLSATLPFSTPCVAQTRSPDVVEVTAAMDDIPRGLLARHITPMSWKEKTSWYVRHSFDPASLAIPALPAAIIMADPPRPYPREWRDGGAALARNFGDCLTTELAANTGKFLVGAVTHEDPRYYPDQNKNGWHRALYAIAFTFVDRSDRGTPRLAISTFAGALSAGFVGRVYLPNGFDDAVHAGQRTTGTLGGYVPTLLVGYATGNLVSEYSPELKWLGRKLHLPFVKE